jgi:hypothetical protein
LASAEVADALYGAGDYDIFVIVGDVQLANKSFKWKVDTTHVTLSAVVAACELT